MAPLLSMAVVAPPMPFGYLWEILFAVILAVSLVCAIKYPSFGKRWILILFVVGVAEMEFSTNTDGYSILIAGLVIGLVTTYSGLIVPALCLANLHHRKKQTKVVFILSGCLELIFGYVGVLTAFSFGINPFFLYFGLLTIGFYSLIIGTASLVFAKPKKQ